MQPSPQGKKRQRGQILVLFELSLMVILGFTALVVDLGMLRNNRQILVNTIDAAALAGGSLMPVDNTVPGHTVADVEALIDQTVAANYGGTPAASVPPPTYRCLIGASATTGAPLVSRDVPGVCDPHNVLGHAPVASDFTGAGPTRTSACDPHLGDKCNVVVVSGNAVTDYALAPVVGVLHGNTGTVSAAACKGPCGAAPVVPVDLVIILDRTYSMTGSSGGMNKITALKDAAKAVLSVYDPALQRVALVLTGPGKVNASGAAITSTSCSPSAYGYYDDDNLTPATYLTAKVTSTTATTIKVAAPKNVAFPSVPFVINIDTEQMKVKTVSGTSAPYTWTVDRGYNGTNKAAHNTIGSTSNYNVNGVEPWTTSSTSFGRWVPVGLSGTDTTSPLPSPSGAAGTYSIGGVPNTSSDIVKAINCISAASMETDLATPIRMAQWYLDHYGRAGVTQGIILETDGHPQMGVNQDGQQAGTYSAFTCQAALAAATAAKADHTKSPDGIQFFTIGYGVDSSVKCPIRTADVTKDNQSYNMDESTTWSNALTTNLLRTMATDSAHYFENPTSSQLAAVFTQAAAMLSKGGAHLIQLYPAPIVTGVSGGTTATVSGKYFTGATSVTFGGGAVGFTVNGDTSITATVPAGASGTTVDVIVTTPGGISAVTAADHYTYP